MGSRVSLLIPPPTRGSNLSGGDRKYLQTLQRRLPLETVDTSAGSYAESAPPAGVNSQSGETNQNQEITYVKTSADANVFTLNGVEGGPYTLTAQLAFLKIKSDGTNWYVGAKSAAAPAAPLVLRTNGVLNGSQTLQNLVAGSSIVLTDDGFGDVTIDAPPASITVPAADSGAGAVGVSLRYARADHVHPAASAPAGVLTLASVTASPAALNVSTEGTRDWLILSPGNNSGADSAVTSWRSKLRGDSLLPTSWRNIAVSSTSGESANSVSPMVVSATAGDEKCDATDIFTAPNQSPTTNSGWWRSLFANPGVSNFGFSFSLIADPSALRTMNLYLGNIINNGGPTQTVTVTCHLLDGSAADLVIPVVLTIGGAAGNIWRRVSVQFASAYSTRMEVTALMTGPSGVNAELAFQALTVS